MMGGVALTTEHLAHTKAAVGLASFSSTMILRYTTLLGLHFLLSLSRSALFARAQDFDCKQTLEGSLYDFTSLGNGEQVVNRTRETPPTKMVDSLAFDLCGDLKPKEGLGEHDQVRPRVTLSPFWPAYRFTVSEWHSRLPHASQCQGKRT